MRLTGLLVEAGGILVAWVALLVAENLLVGIAYRDMFAGSWEMGLARTHLSPILFAALVPASLVLAACARVVRKSETDAVARRVTVIVAVGLGGMLGYGVTFGRHFASWGVRAPFVAGVAIAFGVIAAWAAPRAGRLARQSPRLAIGAGVVTCAACWWSDAHVLPRLYPAFHAALFAGVLASGATVALAFRAAPRGKMMAWVGLGVGVVSLLWARRAAASVRSADNLRLILLEHAPLLGRAVRIATWLAPPPLDDVEDAPAGDGHAAAARVLDWTGRDVLLVSVDALRADHVGAYGYARPTTPHLDALAREGATFDAAYCPTPHTSYSITSMMTGKYMHPLLALGVGEDSETWASYARRYGYRTAAFYPPAVFFIDAPQFARFEERGLDFEYRKVEFATPALRAEQLAEYLATAKAGTPLFVWVHLFEPHEPYVAHPEHPFGIAGSPSDVDAYDSEIAAADDGLGKLVATFRAQRPGGVIVVTADHGEEFGEHGGHYHGTTVYEEQVRVPLVVVGPGVAPRRIAAPVQTIDLLPTVLSALGVPRPPRLRGRDLGARLAGNAVAEPGVAFAETDDYTLYARDAERLVCARKVGACALYDVATDPHETRDLSREREADAREMRKATRALESGAARYESGAGAELPDAIRRGLMGDVEAAPDVAALLDDVKPDLRRRAAEVLFRLHAKETAPALARALARDEDDVVQRFAAVGLLRVGGGGGGGDSRATSLLADADVQWRRRAALAFAEQGDARGEGELVRWWTTEGPPARGLGFEEAREVLAAIAKVRAKDAAPALVGSLSDVRLRPDVADALGALGDPRAKAPLLAAFTEERFVSARPHEARALMKLGARTELAAPLARFAGVPEPMLAAIAIAASAGLLVPERGGWSSPTPTPSIDVTLAAPRGPARLLVLGAPGNAPRGTYGDAPLVFTTDGDTSVAAVPERTGKIAVHIDAAGGLRALWLVPLDKEIPPPAPRPWDGEAGAVDDPR